MTAARGVTQGVTVLGILGAAVLGGSVGRAAVGSVTEEPFAEWGEIEAAAPSLGRGPIDAPAVHIFTDYECPACAALERESGKRWRTLADAGRLRLVLHDAPLSAHQRGAVAAAAMHCVRGEDMWRAHAALYARASEWKNSREPVGAIVEIVRAALDAERVSAAELTSCVTDEATVKAVGAARDRARAWNVHEVPTVIAGGKRLRATSWRALGRFVERRIARS